MNDPPTVVVDERWRHYAACATTPDPGPFYDCRHPNPLCDRCPVSELCLWAALALEDLYGYRFGWWGGVSAARRARITATLPADADFADVYAGKVAAWEPPRRGRPVIADGSRSAA